jgi:hypothetical protein
MNEESQLTDTVLMIRPASFTSNPETAESNRFQQPVDGVDAETLRHRAREEFDRAVEALEAAGVTVLVYEDSAEPETPDALFPNNWLTTHADGRAILYPMQAPSRRLERRFDIVEDLARKGFRLGELVDLSYYEERERFLEGTGSLILDRRNHIAYACLSPRTHPALFHDWCERFGYEPEAFTARDQGADIYHTNVMMCLGDAFVVICSQAIENEQERIRVLSRLERTGHELIDISPGQMGRFAGNMLQLRGRDGEPVIVMSAQAETSLEPRQLERLRAHGRIASAPIDTIESHAGGSFRCMLAEVHLPKAA